MCRQGIPPNSLALVATNSVQVDEERRKSSFGQAVTYLGNRCHPPWFTTQPPVVLGDKYSQPAGGYMASEVLIVHGVHVKSQNGT